MFAHECVALMIQQLFPSLQKHINSGDLMNAILSSGISSIDCDLNNNSFEDNSEHLSEKKSNGLAFTNPSFVHEQASRL